MTTRTAKKTSAPPAPAVHVVEQLLLDDIASHPRNVRRDLGDLTELTASIKADGVRNAIHVVPDARDADGNPVTYLVLQGHRRRQAAVAAGLATIPAVVRHDVTTDHAAVVEMLVENLLRADLTPIEEAAAYEQLRLAGVTAPQIAKRTGRKRATVDARLALMKLPEQARDAVHAAQLSLDEAAALVEFADDEDTVERLTRAAGTSDFRWQLQNAQRRRQAAKTREATLAELSAAGVNVVARPRDYWSKTLSSVLRVSEEVTDQAEREELRRAAHASCPHHAAFLEDLGTATYVCLDPAVHRPAGDDGSSRPPLVTGSGVIAAADVDEDAARERAEREAAVAQAVQDCETAAAVRRTYVVDVVTGRRATLSDAAATAVALAAAQYGVRAYCETEVAGLAEWLEVALPDEPDKGGYEVRRAHDEACEQLVLDALAKVGGHPALLAVLAEWSDGPLRSWHSWEPSAEDMRAGSAERTWLDVLQALGYELTAWEAVRLAAADQWAVDNPTADDEPDDVDEDNEDDADLDGYNAGDDE